ncbi:class I glutamine amidotransferase-like protein [Aspergillus pseudonomiae]|nr:class I glutamine amidotransferase-like protein [Aspergillus pseudonomiae]
MTGSTTPPLHFGVVLFPGFQALDAFGPLDCINVLSWSENVSLSLLASSLDPVTTKPPTLPGAIGQSIVPTHTFGTAPPLDVLLIPGGLGTTGDSPILQEIIIFIQRVYPRLKHLITVCTGSGLAAQAGVLDGKRATSNKKVFKEIISLRPQVHWVYHARWVTDGNIWTSSGVSAGIDATLAWIEEVYGKEKAQDIATEIEYCRHKDASLDPFAGLRASEGPGM